MGYTQVAAGVCHTVLLKSDGTAVACGHNRNGQCSIPPLDEGLTYTQVAAGACHTVLLKSDGTAVACGNNRKGQCSIPPLEAAWYIASRPISIRRVFQATCEKAIMRFVTL